MFAYYRYDRPPNVGWPQDARRQDAFQMTANPKPEPLHFDDLPPPIPGPSPGALGPLAGPLWLIAGVAIALVTLGSPGCTATGPTVGMKGEVSVREVAHAVAANGTHGVGGGPGNGPGGSGELQANLSFTLAWPAK
jgi:hypothetical protein